MLLELIIFVHLRSFFPDFIKGRFSILHPEKKETEHDWMECIILLWKLTVKNRAVSKRIKLHFGYIYVSIPQTT